MSDAPTDSTSTDETATTAAEQGAPAPAEVAETPAESTGEAPADKPAETTGDAPAEKPAKKAAAKKTAAKKAPAKKAAAKKTTAKKAPAKKSAAKARSEAAAQSEQLKLTSETPVDAPADAPVEAPADESTETSSSAAVLFQPPAKKKAPSRAKAKPKAVAVEAAPEVTTEETEEEPVDTAGPDAAAQAADADAPTAAEVDSDAADTADTDTAAEAADTTGTADTDTDADSDTDDTEDDTDEEGEGTGAGQARRRRRRGGRRRRKPGSGNGPNGGADGDDESADAGDAGEAAETSEAPTAKDGEAATDTGSDAEATDADAAEGGDNGDDATGGGGSSSSRRRRRRRRTGEGGQGDEGDDEANTVTRVRKPRSAEDEITSVQGSTRLEAKKQRRREGREAGRRRAPIVSEAEFLARRESVERVMAVRQRKDLTQIAVLEDKVLVEHYVAREAQTSLIGNVYLGRVQNVLPSMEAAFIDIGKGRNAVLYAGEVNWSALGHKDGQPRKIESVLQSGQTVLVQVTKDPVGHKGARLTSQVSLAGRFLVYVPDGTTSGISRKLPDTERARLKSLLKEIVPESAGVIVRTAAEGASEDELTRDVERLKARWEDIEAKVAKGNAPQLLYGEPDLTLKVVRDLFTEDFAKLVVQGDDAWASVKEYVDHVAPDLADRLEHFGADGSGGNGGNGGADLFATYRIDEQIAKGLDRKVWLPSGGSLIIDRTEAMTVIDVNTGKFTGSGGNLEETVTKNNLEAAEEIVRQLRLRDIGGIIVVDFIDMVLEANRDLVLRRLVECLGRDRTRHQVAEVTSLGLVQMTRKRIGTGLLEAFSETCTHCQGRGLVVHDLPVEPKRGGGGGGGADNGEGERRGNRRRRGKGQGEGGEGGNAASGGNGGNGGTPKAVPSPKDIAAMAKPAADEPTDGAAEGADEAPDATLETAVEAAVEKPAPVEDAVTAADQAAVVEEAAVEEAPVDETPVEETPVVEEAPVEEAPVEEAPVEEAAVTEPVVTVVTRTRRRAASRPAGPPAAVEQQAVEPSVEQPGEQPADQSGEQGAGTASAADEPAGEATAAEPHVEHVPVKKKGARKR